LPAAVVSIVVWRLGVAADGSPGVRWVRFDELWLPSRWSQGWFGYGVKFSGVFAVVRVGLKGPRRGAGWRLGAGRARKIERAYGRRDLIPDELLCAAYALQERRGAKVRARGLL